MTEKEAILQLKRISNEYVLSIDNPFDMAIEALEKQIPKKPTTKKPNPHFKYALNYYCPNCNCEVGDETDEYCTHCSQKIDWSE